MHSPLHCKFEEYLPNEWVNFWSFLHPFLMFMTLTILKITGQLFRSMFFNLDSPDVFFFFMIRSGLCSLVRNRK